MSTIKLTNGSGLRLIDGQFIEFDITDVASSSYLDDIKIEYIDDWEYTRIIITEYLNCNQEELPTLDVEFADPEDRIIVNNGYIIVPLTTKILLIRPGKIYTANRIPCDSYIILQLVKIKTKTKAAVRK